MWIDLGPSNLGDDCGGFDGDKPTPAGGGYYPDSAAAPVSQPQMPYINGALVAEIMSMCEQLYIGEGEYSSMWEGINQVG